MDSCFRRNDNPFIENQQFSSNVLYFGSWKEFQPCAVIGILVSALVIK